MKRLAAMCLAAAFGAGSAAVSVRAHHAYGLFFDLCRRVTVEGRIASVQWKDPHVFIELTLDDGTAHRAEWTSPRGLSPRGMTADTLKPGDRVVVTGSTWKDRAVMEPATRALVSDPPPRLVSALTQVRRASDGWSWTRDDGGAPPPECGRQ